MSNLSFWSHKFQKIVNYFEHVRYRKKLEPVGEEFNIYNPKHCYLALRNTRSNVKDPSSGIRGKTYPGSRIQGWKSTGSRIRNAGRLRLENNTFGDWYLLEEFHAVRLQFLHALLQVEHTPVREGRLQADKNKGRNRHNKSRSWKIYFLYLLLLYCGTFDWFVVCVCVGGGGGGGWMPMVL